MESLLQSTLTAMGTKIVCELTWNILKSGSNKIIDSFKGKFMKKYDMSENQCIDFLQDITDNQAINPKKPFTEIISYYEKHTDKECPYEFKEEFQEWIQENYEEFKKIDNKPAQQQSSIVVNGNQYADRGGSIQFIANQYNNIEAVRR
ncbi:hypothetical protein SAMN02745163_02503 [Clostridium cavendishii DSM 21758]|uniref:Uncharacterized protein n=1 Tax=Clostridium cavendishii DSM 21758 TaxID=1121302 RepID=A0A1M6LUN2_9CLOT|nr:hypothetical protein [Clostridium cavendishii]SHJ74904.1 hypothetical protein SAMN02745163_02503 [Clostridium cavendishii DSM 21758]